MSSGKYGVILKREREKKSLSQQGLANAAGVTRRAIVHWEHGTRQMTIESADKVFRALGVSVVIGEGGQIND